MKIGVLGSGEVGKVLVGGFVKYGHQVMAGSRSPEKVEVWKKEIGDEVKTGMFEETASFADVIVLAVHGSAAVDALKLAGTENLAGKTILDATNPIAAEPPEEGVLRFFTDINHSLMETLQETFPEAHFVKAFSCIGKDFMVDPPFQPTPTMFIAGNSAEAKATATTILKEFGWEVEDMGLAQGARAIEPLCMLWCIPGMRGEGWTHAITMLRSGV